MSQHEPEATPEQQAQVRRLLGEARHTEPMPPEVAARLDRVLGQLSAEGPRSIDPPPPPRSAAVVDLAARRRRRVAGLLVAAAFVVVAGVGIGQLVQSSQGGDESSNDAGSGEAFDRAPAPEEGAASENDPGAPTLSASPTSPSDVAPPPPPELTEATFRRVVPTLRDAPGVEVGPGVMVESDQLSEAASFLCDAAMWGPGKVIGVLYEGAPAVLVFRPPVGETQSVELLQCGRPDEVLRSTVLPAP